MDFWAGLADVVQAIVVVGSIFFALLRYRNAKISQARVAVVQMLNLLDEFPVFVSDEDRFKYQEYLQNPKRNEIAKVSEPSWADMAQDVIDFREGFRSNLQGLWLSLDSNRLFFQTSDQTTMKELNNSGNVLKALNEMIFVLKSTDAEDDPDVKLKIDHVHQVQRKKIAVVNRLCAFAESLCAVSKKHGIFNTTLEGKDYMPVLFDYHDWFDKFNQCAVAEFEKEQSQKVALFNIYKTYDPDQNKLIPAEFRIQEYFSHQPIEKQKKNVGWRHLNDEEKNGTLGNIFRDQYKKYYMSGFNTKFTVAREENGFMLTQVPDNEAKP